jgi:divalent metal cation (Fe/Co/Zn/Cd) transporter
MPRARVTALAAVPLGLAFLLRSARGERAPAPEPALIADGNHAQVDGYVSLGVVASAGCAWAGLEIADRVIGRVITLVILRVTWVSWRVVSAAPAEHV